MVKEGFKDANSLPGEVIIVSGTKALSEDPLVSAHTSTAPASLTVYLSLVKDTSTPTAHHIS